MDFIPGRGFDGGEHGWEKYMQEGKKKGGRSYPCGNSRQLQQNWFNESAVKTFFLPCKIAQEKSSLPENQLENLIYVVSLQCRSIDCSYHLIELSIGKYVELLLFNSGHNIKPGYRTTYRAR